MTVDVEPVRLGPEDSGRTLTVEHGRMLLIELPENQSTGYTSEYIVEGTVVEILEDRFYRTVTPEPGTTGTRCILLRVVGSGRFVMKDERTWETKTPEKRFAVEFQIRDRQ